VRDLKGLFAPTAQAVPQSLMNFGPRRLPKPMAWLMAIHPLIVFKLWLAMRHQGDTKARRYKNSI
jgi:hypothetical protein